MRYAARVEELGLKDADISRRSGIPTSTLSRYRNGGAPRAEHVFSLADALELSARALLTGEVEERHWEPAFSPSGSRARDDLVELEEIDLQYGLGATYLDGPIGVARRTFSREWLRLFTRTAPEHLFWTVGDGDSMEPTIRTGEVILIDSSKKTPRMGDGIWAVAMNEIGMIKRLHFPGPGRIELHSDNKVVPPIVVAEDELHVVGRVVAVVRRL